MKITFLGQGYESESPQSVGNKLIHLLSQKGFHTFTGISAFASEAGIIGLSEYINIAKENFKGLNLIVGIDQEGTSKEALQEIKNLRINSYIFYQEETPIFHPKIYLFEGSKETKLIIGSSNLTARGLFGNVEGSLLVEFSNSDTEGAKLLSELKEYYKGLFDFSDPNLFKINTEIIKEFIVKGIVPNEVIRFTKHKKRTSNTDPKITGIVIPKRSVVKIPNTFRGRTKTNKTFNKIITELEIEDKSSSLDLSAPVWSKLSLKTSDILIPDNTSTHTTGRLKLTKSVYPIDQTKYFRLNLFGGYNWSKRVNSDKEDLTLNFKIIIDGVDKGNHELKITYNPRGDAGQNNYNTHISWKGVGNIIREKNLTGKNLFLHKLKKNTNTDPDFVIVIS